MAELTETHRRILEFERSWYRFLGAKAQAVRSAFGHSLVRHQQIVDWIIDQPEALALDAVTVRRLQRLRESRQGARRSGFNVA